MSADSKRSWLFIAAAAIPCVVLLVFCGTALREWWLISTKQIVVIPTPHRGDTSLPEVPAGRIVPFIVVSGALAGLFAYALRRGSRKALAGAWLIVGLGAGLAYLAHLYR